jgi:hypothetical protein
VKVGAWNVESLSEDKQQAAIATAVELGLDAMVLYETWLRPNRGPLQPRHALWHRLDLICRDLHPNAPRGKGGISLLVLQAASATLYRHCPRFHWAIWTTTRSTVAGVYIPPSVPLDEFVRVLDDLATALEAVFMNRPRSLIVVGDFNARLGALVGDHATNARSSAMQAFITRTRLELLNSRLQRSDRRYTWRCPLGKSVVDLALTRDAPCSSFFVGAPPVATPHQLMLVDVADSVEEVVADPSRWAWSRAAFSNPDRRELCSALLAPTMASLARLWGFVSSSLDSQLDDGELYGVAATQRAQSLIDEAYSVTCRAIRCSLLGLACWDPQRNRRGHQTQRHIDWEALARSSDGFFLSSVKSAIQSVARDEVPGGARPATPSVEEFAGVYRQLFAAVPATPRDRVDRIRRSTTSLDEDEEKVFSIASLTELLFRIKWKKAIGPDNMPADVFKCSGVSAAAMLSVMFRVFWTHQILPEIWRKAFVVPIEKKGADLSDPAQWRGIALQSHLKKLFEVQIRNLCRMRGWTQVHLLQTGFQPKTGAIEAVYAVEELTRRYSALSQPLTLVLLDVKKAYDRTPRAFIFRKLRRRGMPEHALGVVQALLDSCQVVLRVDGRLSEPVDVEVGVPQGDVLSPDMFNVYVDDLAERLISVGNRFGGCPKYGDVDIPIVMYADDQTIMHWRHDALQAMLEEAQKYADEHQYQYNVNKCIVTLPEQNLDWPPLTLNGAEIPVSNATSLLGVKITNGLVDHAAQLEDRLAQAKRSIAGLEILGAFRNSELSPARKRLMLTMFGRSQLEYGMPIAPHTRADLKKVDSWLMEISGKCLGGGRGTSLSMRYCGVIPAHPRMAQLRMRFLAGLRNPLRTEASLATSVYRKAAAPPDLRRVRGATAPREPPSVLRRLVRYMPIIDASHALTDKYVAEFKSLWSRDPSDEELPVLERRAATVAMSQLTWADGARRLKLLPLQQHDASVPHPAAYLTGETAVLPGRWLTNLTPGNPAVGKPCDNCAGRYPVSRYHLTRCVDVRALLGPHYCAIAHAAFFSQVDNPVDAMLMDLIPPNARHEAILKKLDKCPIRPRRRQAAALPAPPSSSPRMEVKLWRTRAFQERVHGVGAAIAELRRRCCPRTVGTGAAQVTGSSSSTQDSGRGDDRGTTSQAFTPHGAMAVGMFTAGRRHASPPVLPPAR